MSTVSQTPQVLARIKNEKSFLFLVMSSLRNQDETALRLLTGSHQTTKNSSVNAFC